MDQQGDDDLKSFVDRIVFKESLVGKIHYGEEFEFTAEQAKVVQGCSEQAFELSQRFHRDWSERAVAEAAEFSNAKSNLKKEVDLLDQQLRDVLLPHQVLRINQLANQRRIGTQIETGYAVLPLADQIGLTNSQTKRIRETLPKLQDRLRKSIDSGISDLKEHRLQTRVELLGQLTPLQNDRYEKAIGNEIGFVDNPETWVNGGVERPLGRSRQLVVESKMHEIAIGKFFRAPLRNTAIAELEIVDFQLQKLDVICEKIGEQKKKFRPNSTKSELDDFRSAMVGHHQEILDLLLDDQKARLCQLINQRNFHVDGPRFGLTELKDELSLTPKQENAIKKIVAKRQREFLMKTKELVSKTVQLRKILLGEILDQLDDEQKARYANLIGPFEDINNRSKALLLKKHLQREVGR